MSEKLQNVHFNLPTKFQFDVNVISHHIIFYNRCEQLQLIPRVHASLKTWTVLVTK